MTEPIAGPSPDAIENPAVARQRLPNRRAHLLLSFEHNGHLYVGGLGMFESGRLAEIFLDASAKIGTDVATAARDSAVAASLLLQHGCPADTLRRALTRNANGTASGPLGHLLDLFAAESVWMMVFWP